VDEMKKITSGLIVALLLLATPMMNANAQVSVGIGIGLPNLSIGINLPMYPDLVPVPGYPVYYAPQVDANYFFYDSMYWVYQNDNWYASTWYNGPWGFVEPAVVPSFILRIPVRYYRQPPVYFRGWQSNAAPRWGQHWGNGWERNRRGWDKWNKSSVPARAPRPAYQRQYTGNRYPGVEQQHQLRGQQYRYAPRDKAVREHLKQPEKHNAPAAPPVQRGRQPEQQHPGQPQQGAPSVQHPQQPQRGGDHLQKSAPERPNPQQQRGPAVQEQRPQERRGNQEQGRGNGQGRERDEDRGRGR
jgi:hypothetical protein